LSVTETLKLLRGVGSELVGLCFWLCLEVILVKGLEKNMFWRDRERESKEQNGGPPCGQVRVLVVGDSGTSCDLF
jgi:hypothetical protein